MNCLEFRRAAAIDPRRLDAVAAAHVLQCQACRESLAHVLKLERRLEGALRVPPPPGLRERILERAVRRPRAARWYALAASIMVAVALAAGVAFAPGDDPLARAGIDFVVYEEAQSIADAKPADAGMLARVAREMGVALPEQLGEIRCVCFYLFAGGPAYHLLATTPLGKVTLLLIPGRPLAARAAASAHGLEATVMPVRGGAAVIIGDSSRSIARTATLLKSPLAKSL